MSSRNHRATLGAALATGLALAAAALPASAQIVFDGNIIFGNGNLTQAGQYRTDNMTAACPVGFTTQQLAEVSYLENSYVDPLLNAALDLLNPVWRPAAASPAFANNPGHGKVVNVPADGWFEQVCYTGALDSIPANDWTQGWTYYDSLGLGRTDLDLTRPIRILDNLRFAGVYTLVPDTNYVLRGQIRVLDGGKLVVLADVQVFGERATTGTLIVERGGKIDAQGTAAQPIVFTSDDALLSLPQTRGAWGGLNILGRALAN